MSEQIHSYYNVLISNKNNYAIPAEFNETQTIPYLDHAEDYEMTIVRFKVPCIMYLCSPTQMMTQLTLINSS